MYKPIRKVNIMSFCAFFVFLSRLFLAYLIKYVLRRGVKEKRKIHQKSIVLTLRIGSFIVLCIFCISRGFATEAGSQWSNRVYLATYPRSGNHWVRYLIEEATQIATSSVYCDGDVGRSHLGKPFPWGGYSPKYGYEKQCRYPLPEDIVVVKTHYPAVPAQKFDRMPYIKVIRVVRHPVDSLYSFYVFEKKNKTCPRIPLDLLKKRIKSWRKFHEYWDRQANAVTVRYEDLLSAPHATLALVLQEMGYAVNDEEVQRAVNRYPPQGHLLKHLEQFFSEDLDLIKAELGDLMRQFDYSIP